MKRTGIVLVALLVAALVSPPAAHAEMIEEIIAWVNGEIITKSEYDEEEQARVAELYQNLTGDELDTAVQQTRSRLLLDMIDRKILVQQAQAIGYDLDEMGRVFLDQFKEHRQIANDQELERLLGGAGMTIDDLKEDLIELYAPDEVIRFEVTSRVAVSDREIETFYAENQDQFFVEGEVTLREIVLLADTEAAKNERRPLAQELRQRIEAGEDFGELAELHSESGTREAKGLFGPLKKGDLAESLVGPAFTLPEGAVTEVMETPYGFHIVRVESRVDDHVLALDEIRDDVQRLLENRKLSAELNDFLERARSESEWCVKPKHQSLLPIPAPAACETL